MNFIKPTILSLFFLKRNSKARKNFTPALRYFAASAALRPQNASIGAILKTAQPRINFSKTKLLSFTLLIFVAQISFAQNKKATTNQMVNKTKHSLTNNIENFQFKAKKAATYNVLVLSPTAEVISKPIKNKKLSLNEELDFSINTKYWKPGTYRIFIQIDGITIEQRQLIIKRQRQ